MDKTRSNSAAGAEHESSLPVAYQRAPTLLTSASGLRGEVRVWSPDQTLIRREICRTVLSTAILFIAFDAVYWALHVFAGWPFHPWAALYGAVLPVTSPLIQLLQARNRPRSISADLTGIAITTSRGSRSLRWDEITAANFWAVRFVRGAGSEITLRSGETVGMNLVGFREVDRKTLRHVIIERASLTRDPKWTDRHYRNGLPEKNALPGAEATPGSLE